ncbi:nuclear transport factor 2 family protein [Nocardia callitridis]
MTATFASMLERIQAIEDRLAIQSLIATHPLSADTGAPPLLERIYAEDAVFDRGPGLSGATDRNAIIDMMWCEPHRQAIAGGLAHFGSPPLIELDGDKASAVSYSMLVTPDRDGEERELPNHGMSTGYRIHRVLVNRWTLSRIADDWKIIARKIAPADGAGPALDLLREWAH